MAALDVTHFAFSATGVAITELTGGVVEETLVASVARLSPEVPLALALSCFLVAVCTFRPRFVADTGSTSSGDIRVSRSTFLTVASCEVFLTRTFVVDCETLISDSSIGVALTWLAYRWIVITG